MHRPIAIIETVELKRLRDAENYHTSFDGKSTKRLLRKIDFYLIPFLALLYLLSFLDRINIGNARLAGLEADLHMKGLDYNTALAIFFPFYVAAEIPSNLMMSFTRPSLWIPFIMVIWGFMCVAMGFVKSYPGLLGVRSALGLAEGGLFPGVAFYITLWYRRHECGLRMAIFFSAATAAGAFGGLFSRAIMEMDGVAKLASWQWIFILEGLVTLLVGITAFFVMHDYPDTAKFLTVEEKAEVYERLEDDRDSLAQEYRLCFVWDALTDWKIWAYCIITIGIFTPLYCISLFLPTIIKDLGYTDNKAQLMTVPPYTLACLFCVGAGFLADRSRQRGLYVIFFSLVAMVGSIILLRSNDDKIKYIGTFLLASGIYPNVPQIVAWNGNNIGGRTKRGVGIALQVMVGNLGGILSAFMFLPRDGPQYRHGHAALIAFSLAAGLLSFAMSFWLRVENSRRNHVYKAPAEYSAIEKHYEREYGDYASFFRYTV